MVYLLLLMSQHTATKGFTLIELIIVIALIALLSTTVILVINPIRLFQEARDSQRMADINQMSRAMSLMLATNSQPVLGPSPANCYVAKALQVCTARYVSAAASTINATSAANVGFVTGGGWVPVNLGTFPAISAWPVDPTNAIGSATSTFYSYAYDSANAWEFTAAMESVRYGSSTNVDSMIAKDGGNQPLLYEVGTNVGL